MEWQNYHHLFYFWTIVKEGGVTRASEKLKLAQSTVSTQMRQLEESLGENLFKKEGRRLVMTEAGQVVYRYAEEIFLLGQEMRETLRGRPTGESLKMVVGITNSLPKTIAHRLLQPAFSISESVYLVCKEDHFEELLSQLALHRIDLVLSDAPLSSSLKIKAYNHLLGECGTSFFSTKALKDKNSAKFPELLNGAPFLYPTLDSPSRRSLDQWFENHHISPHPVAEFADSALLKVFAQSGKGFFAAPSVIEEEIKKQCAVVCVGRTSEVREEFYAISAERRIKHPAVIAICESARKRLF